MKLKLLSIFMAVSASALAAVDYTAGVFIVNEDWYGHQNSTVNYFLPNAPAGENWHYRVFQSENPGRELGCTNQFGAIWNGRFYFIAKQERDPGAEITGARITVADAKTMKCLFQSVNIDPTGEQCDGRGFVGVTASKGYISSSHGVWVFDLDNYKVLGQVPGTENPNGHSSGGNTNAAGALYHGQCGSMVLADGRVFVAHQAYGLLVIDPDRDEVTDKISMDIAAPGAGIGSVVKAADGNLYLSVCEDIDGMGAMLPEIVRVNPSTLETAVINLPEGIYPPASSWYAWTPDGFCASSSTNVLYWNGGENNWFSAQQIFKYDIDTGTFGRIIDLEHETGEEVAWKLYGCSMRVHPQTDELYMSLYHEFGTPVYVLRRYDADGNKLAEYSMIENYWFPSLPVFPTDPNNQSSIFDLRADGRTDNRIYDLRGRAYSPSTALPGGIYIKNNRKFIIH